MNHMDLLEGELISSSSSSKTRVTSTLAENEVMGTEAERVSTTCGLCFTFSVN